MTSSLLFIVALLSLPVSALAADCGKMISLSGTVDIHRNPTKTTDEANPPRTTFSAEANAPIRCDDIIESHDRSSAVMLLPRGKIAIGSNTKVAIAKYSNEDKPQVNMVDLFFGQLRALITKKKGPPSATPAAQFQIRTPTAVSGVRGTDFFVAYDEKTKVTEQATLEGQVEVTSNQSSAPILVSAGEQVSVKANQKLEKTLLTIEVKNKIRATSTPIRDDYEFTALDPRPSRPLKTAYAPNLSADRWILAFGPSVAKINHANDDYSNGSPDGSSFSLQYQKPKKGKSNVFGLSYTKLKNNHSNGSGMSSRLSFLDFEWGVRFRHDKWWSPYGRIGLGYVENKTEVSGMSLDLKYASLFGLVGIDAIYKPEGWDSVGFYGAFDGQLNQTLLAIKKSNSNYPNDASLNALIVTARAGLAAEF